jgi:hypothetical protein
MNKGNNITYRLLRALTSDNKNFGKILLDEETTTRCTDYENPLEKAFMEHFTSTDNKDSLCAIALIATLYLSVAHCEFPTTLFRASVNYLRDNLSLPTFNCNHYENLYARLSNEDSIEIQLFENIDKFAKINLTKKQIFDAFDFLSNGL